MTPGNSPDLQEHSSLVAGATAHGKEILVLLGTTDALGVGENGGQPLTAVLAPRFTLADILRADLPLRVDLGDEEAVRCQVTSLGKSFHVRGVVALDDELMKLAGRAASWLGLEEPLRWSWLERCTHKGKMRETLAADPGLSIPFRRVADASELEVAIDAIGLPCVVKPAEGTNSKFVHYSEKRGMAIEAGRRILEQYGEALVEPFLAGPEFSVESVTLNGKTTVAAVCEKILAPLPYFVEIGHLLPTRLGQAVEGQIAETAKRALATLGVDRAVTHTEIRLTEAGPKVLEVNPRPAGGRMRQFIGTVTGYDLHDLAIRAVLGLAPRRMQTGVTHGIYFCLTIEAEGFVSYDPNYLRSPLAAGLYPLVELTVVPRERVYPVNHPQGKVLGRILTYGCGFDEAWWEVSRILSELQLQFIPFPAERGSGLPRPSAAALESVQVQQAAADLAREPSCCDSQDDRSVTEELPEPAGAWSHGCC